MKDRTLLILKSIVMGLFTSKDKQIIKSLCKKSEEISNEISKEIDELFVELKLEYDENQEVVTEFSNFVNEIKSKLNPDEASKLLDFSERMKKVKRCAKKGVEAMRELSRDQKKATRETAREYQEYMYV